MSQFEDLEAINRMISKTSTVNSKAFDLQRDWNQWYANLTWFQKATSADTMAIAVRKRTDFNDANRTASGKALAPAALPVGTSQNSAALVNFNPSSMPTIKQGSKEKDAVMVWQRIVGAVPIDGAFGPGTHKATVAWQQAHGLGADGVVGQKSWTKAAEKKISVPAAINQTATPKPAPKVILQDVPATQMPTIKAGSKETAAIKTWQGIIGVKADGVFGSGTTAATKTWQKARGLTADGIVGAKSWDAARKEPVKLQAAPAPVAAPKPAPKPVAAAPAKPAAVSTPAPKPTAGSVYVPPKVAAAQPATPIKVPAAIDTTPPKVSSGSFDPAKMPTIKAGSTNVGAVEIWQRIIGVKADGIFGSGTTAATKTWQKSRGLSADGVVGPASWNATGGKIPATSAATAAKLSDSAVKTAKKAKEAVLAAPSQLATKAKGLPLWKQIVLGFVVVGGGAIAYNKVKERNAA